MATQAPNSIFMFLLYAWQNSWNNTVFCFFFSTTTATNWTLQNYTFYLLKCSLTNVIVICFTVELLVDPVLLNIKNLLAAGILLPKGTAQNHLQPLRFISEKDMKCVCMLPGKTCLNDLWEMFESHSYLSSKQCAAERTQQEAMRIPPHRWKCCLRRAW